MQSSPIDFLAGAPKPHQAASTETESDGRFSELLRGPSKADAEQPDVSASPGADPAATSDGQAGNGGTVAAAVQAPVLPAAAPPPPATPNAANVGANPLAIAPEAIEPAQPDSALPVLADGEGPDSQPETLSAHTPNSASPIVAPQAPAPLHDAMGTPVPARSTDGAIRATQPVGPAIPANQAAHANLANPVIPAEPGSPDAAAGMTRPSPTTATQPATAGPVAAADLAAAADALGSKTVPTSAVTQPKADAVVGATPDRPMPMATSRPALTQTAAPVAAGRPQSPDLAEWPVTSGSKVAFQPTRALSNVAAAANPAVPATTTRAHTSPGAITPTTVPSTVAEIAETPTPGSLMTLNSATAMTPGQAGPASAASAPPTELAHAQPSTQAVSEQVVLQVRRAVREGVDRLTVHLKPASLGRVDVQMEVGHDGRVQAVISAERPETLHLLQRDARALSEALNDTGLQTDSGSLSFNLRGQTGERAGGEGHAPSDAARTEIPDPADEIDPAATQITLTLGDGRVDIKV